MSLNIVHVGAGIIRFSSIGGKSEPITRLLIEGVGGSSFAPDLVRIPSCVAISYLPRAVRNKHIKEIHLALSDRELVVSKLGRADVCVSHCRKSGIKLRGRLVLATILLPSFSGLDIDGVRHTPRVTFISNSRRLQSRLALEINGNGKGGGEKGEIRGAVRITGAKRARLEIDTLRIVGETISIDLNGQAVPPRNAAGLEINISLHRLAVAGGHPQILLVYGSPQGTGAVLGVGVRR